MARFHVHERSTACPSLSRTIEACLVFVACVTVHVHARSTSLSLRLQSNRGLFTCVTVHVHARNAAFPSVSRVIEACLRA